MGNWGLQMGLGAVFGAVGVIGFVLCLLDGAGIASLLGNLALTAAGALFFLLARKRIRENRAQEEEAARRERENRDPYQKMRMP